LLVFLTDVLGFVVFEALAPAFFVGTLGFLDAVVLLAGFLAGFLGLGFAAFFVGAFLTAGLATLGGVGIGVGEVFCVISDAIMAS